MPDPTVDARLRDMQQQHGRHLRSYLLHIGLSTMDAEDVVQETFIRAWLHLDSLDRDRELQWLFTVARRIAIDLHRARKVRPLEVSHVENWGEWGAPTDGGIGQVIDGLVAQQLLASMKMPHRQVLVLRYLCDLTPTETAAVLDVPVGTVKSRVHYAGAAAVREA